MTKLIAMVDGSVYSESICDHTAWIAKRAGAEVDLVHVIGRRDASSDSTNLSGSIGLGARTALLAELADLDAQKAKFAQKRGRAILVDAEDRVSGAGIQHVKTKLRNGEIVETVQELETGADLIIMGKRGEAADFDKLHLGSNLERVLRSARTPVLVASRHFKAPMNFLLAFDGGKSSIRAVDFIAARPHYKDLHCTLLMVGNESTENRRSIEGAAATLRDGGFTVDPVIKPGQHPESVIAGHVEESGVDLVVMGAYGHSRIRNFIIGSTTTEMVRSCLIPVMLFH